MLLLVVAPLVIADGLPTQYLDPVALEEFYGA
jgi:hypothetical protein